MAVRLRLSRIGRKKVPFFRLVAIDSKKSRDGEALDILGTYNGLTGEIMNFDFDKTDLWVTRGAQMVDSFKKIYKKAKKNKMSNFSSVAV
jgi:small subunit ribosomal protein S16